MSETNATMSYNFEVAKVVAILLVFTGHFHTGVEGFWIIVSIGLFVFGFSSAFFTSAKYHDVFHFKPFWKNKAVRLVPDVLLINIFLLVLFLAQHREGLFTWQTGVHVLGLTGFLNWFGVDNPSPFGGGLWFFTLLLLFYAIYPLLRLIGRSKVALYIMVLVTFASAVWLTDNTKMGHALWFTAWSFIFGIFVQRTGMSMGAIVSGGIALVLASVLAALNVAWNLNQLNTVLIFAVSVSVVLWLKSARLPRRPLAPLAALSGLILSIYFLHGYLYVSVTEYRLPDYILSLVCVLSAAWLVSRVASFLRMRLGLATRISR
jgi:hypothetical protein